MPTVAEFWDEFEKCLEANARQAPDEYMVGDSSPEGYAHRVRLKFQERAESGRLNSINLDSLTFR